MKREFQAFQKKIGPAIRELRKAGAMLEKELAAKAKIKPQALSYIETGDKAPGLRSIFHIAAALKLKTSELIAYAEGMR